MSDATEHEALIAAEYGTYVAAEAIFIAGARAFNQGDAVPVSHLERGVVTAEQVVKANTKAGKSLAGVTDEPKP